MVERGAERLGRTGVVHELQLQVDDEERGDDRRAREREQGRHEPLRREPEGREHEGHEREAGDDPAEDGALGDPPRELGADETTEPVAEEEEGDARAGLPGHLRHGRGDVGVHREHPAEAEGAREHREPQRRIAQRAQLPTSGGRRIAGSPGHGEGHEGGREEAEQSDDGVGRAPAGDLPEPRRGRHPEHVGGRDAEHDPPDRPPPVRRLDERGGHEGGQPEEGAVRQPGDEARTEHRRVAGRERRCRVADREEAHESHEQPLTRIPREADRDERRPDDDPERVGRDRVPGRRNVGADPLGDLREQAHGHEFGRADGESADDERGDRGRRPTRGHRHRSGAAGVCGSGGALGRVRGRVRGRRWDGGAGGGHDARA